MTISEHYAALERMNQALDIAVKWIKSEVAYWHTTGCQGTDWENDVNAMLSKINQLRTLPATKTEAEAIADLMEQLED